MCKASWRVRKAECIQSMQSTTQVYSSSHSQTPFAMYPHPRFVLNVVIVNHQQTCHFYQTLIWEVHVKQTGGMCMCTWCWTLMLTLLNNLFFCSLSRLSIFLMGGRYNSSEGSREYNTQSKWNFTFTSNKKSEVFGTLVTVRCLVHFSLTDFSEKGLCRKKKKKRPCAIVNTQLSVSVGLLYGSIRIYFTLKMSSF